MYRRPKGPTSSLQMETLVIKNQVLLKPKSYYYFINYGHVYSFIVSTCNLSQEQYISLISSLTNTCHPRLSSVCVAPNCQLIALYAKLMASNSSVLGLTLELRKPNKRDLPHVAMQ